MITRLEFAKVSFSFSRNCRVYCGDDYQSSGSPRGDGGKQRTPSSILEEERSGLNWSKQGDLGKQRVDALTLDDRGHSSYKPSRTRVIRNAVTNRISSAWKSEFLLLVCLVTCHSGPIPHINSDAISSGAFNDSDAEAVRGLENLGGTRLYDRVNRQR